MGRDVNGWHPLDALVRERRRALTAYAFLLCSDLREAEDLVQDALVSVFAGRRPPREVDALEAYVRRTIRNTYIDGFRRRRRWAAMRHLHATPDTQPPSELATSDHVPARVDVQRALGALGARERTCVILRFFDDLTVPQIAAELDLSPGSVKRYLSDAVGRLEALLGPLPEARMEDLDVITLGGAR